MPTGLNVPLTFEIHKGGQLLRTETLTQDIIKIGKLSSSHLRIDDDSVSRMHAVIEIVGPSEIYVIDLGSTKGTVVNGQKINKCRIQSGDEIILGDTRVLVTVGEAVQTGAPAPVSENRSGGVRSTVMGMKTAPSTPEFTPSSMGAVIPPPVAAYIPPPVAAHIPPPVAAPAAPQRAAAAPAPAQPTFAAPQFHPALDPEAVEVRDGSRAVEVVAMFEDAIVETRYLTKFSLVGELKLIQPQTIAMIAAGILSFVVGFALFMVAMVWSYQNAALKEEWEKTHTDGTAFPTQRSGVGGDIAFVALLISGVGLTLRGLIRLHGERPSRDNIKDFTIGPDDKAIVNVPAESVPVESFPLVRATGQAYELLFTPSMRGDITLDGRQMSLADLASSGKSHSSSEVSGAQAFVIPESCRAKIDLGDTTFLVNSVPPPRRYPKPFRPDWNVLMYVGGTAFVCCLFLGMIFSLPPDPKSLSLDAFMNDQRFAKFLIKPPEEKEEQIPEWLKKKGPDEAGGKGKRHKGEEGKMGKKTSKNKAGLYALKGPKDNADPHLAKVFAEEAAKSAGVLGILKQEQGSHLASIFGRDSALGNDAENVLGGLVGTQVGEAFGNGGLGLVGTGRGGGGTGEGTIGLGNLGTIGKGGGGGSGSGYGRGAGGLGGRRAHAPDVVPGTAQVRGALDKEIIRRIIRRHINEVKFCYEKELAKKPDLYGRVMVQFTIAGTGAVVASVVQNSTMNNPPVEQCIAGAVRRWEFPKPQGGGVVIVSYPFVLKASGGEE